MNEADKKGEAAKSNTSAEDYLRGKYGAYKGHYAWRALEEAFNAGKHSQPVQPVEPVAWVDDRGTRYPSKKSLEKYLPKGRTAYPITPTQTAVAHPPSDVVRELVEMLEEYIDADCDPIELNTRKQSAISTLAKAKEYGL